MMSASGSTSDLSEAEGDFEQQKLPPAPRNVEADGDTGLTDKHRRPYGQRRIAFNAVLLTFVVVGIAGASLTAFAMLNPNLVTADIGPYVHVDLVAKQLTVARGGRPALTIYLGETVGVMYEIVDKKTVDHVKVQWLDNGTILTVDRMTPTEQQGVDASGDSPGFDLITVSWSSPTLQTLEDRVRLSGAHWFGGCELYTQAWPLERQEAPSSPYVTADIFSGQYGGIAERLWLSSRLVAIHVPDDIPLWLEINANGSECLGLKSQYSNCVYDNFRATVNTTPTLTYTIAVSNVDGDTTWRFNRRLVDYFYAKPDGWPVEDMIKRPIWSTWAQFKKDINESRVLDFARAIVDNGFPISQLEIDDEWQTHYGDLVFDPVKFPDPKNMTTILADELNITRTTLWTHPFVDLDSDTFKDEANHRYFLRTSDGGLLLSNWWDGVGAVIDATDGQARAWYESRLRELLNTSGITSYKFDAGEVNWLGPSVRYANGSWPNVYTTDYAKMSAQLGNRIEVRVATATHDMGVFVRLLDRNSRWGLDNGLQSMITAMLMASSIGYSFVMPDMVGGNGYDGQLPDRELYIRWVQATALLPTVQFSIAPWDYDDERIREHFAQVVSISRSMVADDGLRGLFADYIVLCAQQPGVPIINPIFKCDDSEEALTNGRQFLVGPLVMVAPVLTPNTTEIEVYLPRMECDPSNSSSSSAAPDVWINLLDGSAHRAGQTIRQTVELSDLAVYVRYVSPDRKTTDRENPDNRQPNDWTFVTPYIRQVLDRHGKQVQQLLVTGPETSR